MFSKLNIIVLILILGSSYVYAVGTYPAVDPNMVLYYHFNNQSAYGENDTKVYDFSGRGNNGTANNTQFQAGTGILNDGSMYFNGVNATIKISKPNLILQNGTISFWTIPINTGSSVLFFGGNLNTRFSMYYNSNLGITMQLGNPLKELYYKGNLYNNVKYNIVLSWFTINSTTAQANLYLNGLLVNSTTFNGIGTAASKFYLGTASSGLGAYYKGNLDDFIIYNKTLNSSVILMNYDNYIHDCGVSPTSGCILQGGRNYTFVNSTYYLNSSSVYDPITIKGSNIILDCNGSTIYFSFFKNSSSVINNLGYSNIIIQNCTFISNITDYKNPYVIYSKYGSKVVIRNNKFITKTGRMAVDFFSYGDTDTQFYNNIINSSNNIGNYAIGGNSTYGVFSQFSSHASYHDNIINLNDSFNSVGILVYYGTNSFSYNNQINSNCVIDDICFSTGIAYKHNASYGIIDSNNITFHRGKLNLGIFFETGTSYTNITNNNLYSEGNSSYGILFDTNGCFNIVAYNTIETFGHLANGIYTTTTPVNFNYDGEVCDMVNNSYLYNNITIHYRALDTSYPLTTGIYLKPSNLTGTIVKGNLIWSNSSGIYSYRSRGNFLYDNVIDSYYAGIFLKTNPFNYTILNNSVNYIYLENTNSEGYTLFSGSSSIYNLSNALIYFSNNSGIISSGNINITLTPNNYSYVLDNFNLTEGVSRDNSPLWFSYSTGKTKRIVSSNLTDTISVDVVMNFTNCTGLNPYIYNSLGGHILTNYICIDGITTFNDLSIIHGQNQIRKNSCVCPSIGDYLVNLSHTCDIDTVCDIPLNKFNFTGIGNVTISKEVNISNMTLPTAGQTIYISSTGKIGVSG